MIFKLLIVDDEATMRKGIANFMDWASIGCEVAGTASDGLEAVNKVSASPEGYYDFIIMDIQMPVMDGLEATRQIRLLDRQDTKDLPIVAMSANAFAEDVRLSLEAGMNEHIAKPIEIDRLYSVMGKWFR